MATLNAHGKKFYTNALNYMDILHAETCQPQMKIAKFIVAARHHLASSAMNPKGSKKSTEQSKEKMENPINSIKKGTADNRHSHQTTATKCKNRCPTPHPCKHDNTSHSQINGNKENTDNLPPMDSRTFHIDTIQPSLQDHFKCITRPSNDSHAKLSCIPILHNNKPHQPLTQETKQQYNQQTLDCNQHVNHHFYPHHQHQLDNT